MKQNWWRWLGGLLVLYSIIAGLLINVPQLPVIHESIRNLFYHVPMWFAMISMFFAGLINSLLYLKHFNMKFDRIAVESVNTGLLFSFLGLFTGMIWARFTWGDFWVNDPQLNGAAITILMYLAYLVLRHGIEEEQKRARISAVYNIFAFVLMIVFIGILPRLSEGSIHPGKDGNPALGVKGLDATMRLVFYPALVGWIIIAFIIRKIRLNQAQLKDKILDKF
jgi:heme exporter protein C